MNKNLNIIKGLEIVKFRGFENQRFDIGRNLTIIFGQNGTLKSTLLGMVAQPFYFSTGKETLYTNDYKGNEAESFLSQVNGNPFESIYSQIFRMSESDKAAHKSQPYEYYIEIDGENVSFSVENSGHENKLLVKSHLINEKGKERFRLVGGSSSHKKSQGNFPHPVIYLGLNRLYPLALSTLDEKKTIELTDEEKNWFEDCYSLVLAKEPTYSGVSTSSPKEAKKAAYVLHSDEICNYKSVSAGQDNVGQILTALLSFRRLKSKLGEKYKGGLLLIDELDASLHPISQQELLSFLCAQSEELGVQIVTTSHSVVILEKAFHSKLRAQITPVHIVQKYRSYSFSITKSDGEMLYHSIYKDLFHAFKKESKKLTVLVEDSSAASYLSRILSGNIRSYIEISGTTEDSESTVENASCNYLRWLASYSPVCKKIPILFVFDGDQNISNSTIKQKSLILLGGSYPEKVLYDFFKNNYDWDNNPLKLSFTADTCFQGYRRVDIVQLHSFSDEQTMYKKWYSMMAKPSKMGKGCSKGWQAYKKHFSHEVQEFEKEFVKKANEVLKNTTDEYSVTKDFFKGYLEKLEHSKKEEKATIQTMKKKEDGIPPSKTSVIKERKNRTPKTSSTSKSNVDSKALLPPELPGFSV